MSTIDPILDPALGGATRDAAAPGHVSPIVAALTSSDHKVIGRLLIASSLLLAVGTAVLGVLLGIERVDGDGTVFASRALPEMFAGYRIGLVFGAVVPLLLGVCVVVVPLQLGARSLAFPRLAAAGFWTWFAGVVLLIVALFQDGGPGGGDTDMVLLSVSAIGLMVVGLAAVALTVATSVLTTRAPGMKLHRAPLFSWSALVFALGVVLALPVLLGVVVYLYMDIRYTAAEDSLFGGSAGVADWSTWLLTGPSLALFAVPAVGFLADQLAPTFRTRLPVRGVALAGLAFVGVGVFTAVTQRREIILPGTGNAVDGHNWLTKLGTLTEWALLTLLPALGIAIILGLVGLLSKPPSKAARRPAGTAVKPRPSAALLFGMFGTLLVLVGVLGAAVNGIEDLGLIGTVFEEGASVALVYGAVLAGLGAIAYWSPKWTGRTVPDLPLAGLGTLGAIGALLASVPYLIAGFADQPANAAVYSYDGPSGLWNIGVLIGHGVFGFTVVAIAGLVLKPGADSQRAGDDPYDGQTLEWATTSPAPPENFTTTPLVHSPEPLLDLKTSAPAVPGGSE